MGRKPKNVSQPVCFIQDNVSYRPFESFKVERAELEEDTIEPPDENIPLIEKFKPKRSGDCIGNKDSIQAIRNWIDRIKRGEPAKKILLISGPAGTGKTLISHLVLRETGFWPIEFNSGHTRNKKAVNDVVRECLESRGFAILQPGCIGNAIIMDEIDGMTSGDTGGLKELVRIVNPSKGKTGISRKEREESKNIILPPIICICNQRYNSKINELAQESEEVCFTRIPESELHSLIQTVVDSEKRFRFTKDDIQKIVQSSDGDIRRMFQLLELLRQPSEGRKIRIKKIDEILESAQKDSEKIIHQATKSLFEDPSDFESALLDYHLDSSLIPMMIHEHYTDYYSPELVSEASDCIGMICQGDRIHQMIFENQHWDLYDTHGMISSVIPGKMTRIKGNGKKFEKLERFTRALGRISLGYSHKGDFNDKLIQSGFFDINNTNYYYLMKEYYACILSQPDSDTEKIVRQMHDSGIYPEFIYTLIKDCSVGSEPYKKHLSGSNRRKTAIKKVWEQLYGDEPELAGSEKEPSSSDD